ncbi:MAG: hypothetical protein ISS93_02220 [Candidatus Aenigmarchaeota archaeon]|nr:hypothetical protein [Candidatus Aenigmarchaeota archaeon]
MSQFRGGTWPGLAGLAVVSALLIAGTLFLTYIIQTPVVGFLAEKTFGTTIRLDFKPFDEGTKLNSFLMADKGDGKYIWLLGLPELEPAARNSVKKTLGVLDLSLVVKDGEKEIFSEGNVRESKGKFFDFPLPGKRRGRLGIDVI